MKKLIVIVASLLVLLLVATACAPGTPEETTPKTTPANGVETTAKTEPAGKIGEGRTLVVGIWGSTQEDIARELIIPRFEEETGATVELILGGSSDRNALLYAELDNPSMDVVYLSMAQAEAADKAEVIQPPNPDGVPEFNNLYEPAQKSGGYGVSFMSVGLMYSTKEFQKAPSSWMVCWDEAYRGRVAPFVFPGTQGTAFLIMAARLHGGDENNIQPGIDAIAELKPIPMFASGIDELNLAFETGDVVLCPQIDGYVVTYKEAGGSVDFVVPEEGGILSMNCATIPKNAKNTDLAEIWINIHLGQEVQEAYAERLFYGPTSSTVVLDDELAGKVLYGLDQVKKLIVPDNELISEKQSEWAELWNTQIVD
ncbi:MAG: extracellular solute-binding protein [Fastidiosipila sp.]|nr:extracellular solute-binding protein [Fastidiosipila sp.]